MNKPRRIRIYKLSAFDTFTEEERALNEAYKKAGIKERATLKKIRDEKIASYEGIREIDKKKLVLPEPLKTFGTHEVPVKLHKDVTAKLMVKITEA